MLKRYKFWIKFSCMIHTSIFIQHFSVCEPFSKSACEAVGRKKGWTFKSSSSSSYEKGCYAYTEASEKYPDRIYYGTGGNDTENAATLKDPKFRPQGYDCHLGIISKCRINKCEVSNNKIKTTSSYPRLKFL